MPDEIMGHQAYSIAEYLKMPNTPQPYLVERMVYEHGKTVVVAKPKMGKSWFTIKLGLSVALGEPLMGLQVKRARVLLLEFDRRFLRATVQEIAQGRDTEAMHILPARGIALNDFNGYQLLLALLGGRMTTTPIAPGSRPLIRSKNSSLLATS